MEEFDVYKDISERTDGDIYIGVVLSEPENRRL